MVDDGESRAAQERSPAGGHGPEVHVGFPGVEHSEMQMQDYTCI